MKRSIEDAIRSADRSRTLTSEESDRIWERARAEQARPETGSAEVLEFTPRTRPVSRSLRAPWLVGAAVVAAAATLMVAGPWSNQSIVVNQASDGSKAVETPRATPAEVLAVCDGSVAQLADALLAWGTVSDWAASGDGQPDVGQLTVIAIQDVAVLDPAAGHTATHVEQALATRLAGAPTRGADVVGHEAAVRLGASQIIESLMPLDTGDECELGPLGALSDE